jgi:hypothetical protein
MESQWSGDDFLDVWEKDRQPAKHLAGRRRLMLSSLWQQNTNKHGLNDNAFRSTADTS